MSDRVPFAVGSALGDDHVQPLVFEGGLVEDVLDERAVAHDEDGVAAFEEALREVVQARLGQADDLLQRRSQLDDLGLDFRDVFVAFDLSDVHVEEVLEEVADGLGQRGLP